MDAVEDPLALLRALNRTAPFNMWCGLEVIRAERGEAEIRMPWRGEAAQYSGFLHAGLIGALIDTACGFAAVTVAGRVLASHYSVSCLRPAVGAAFIARARVVKAGKSQVFAACELFALSRTEERHAEERGAEEGQAEERLVATGETLLTVVHDSKTA